MSEIYADVDNGYMFNVSIVYINGLDVNSFEIAAHPER